MDDSVFDVSFSIAVVGDSGCGKSALLSQEVSNFYGRAPFSPSSSGSTGGVDVSVEDKIYRLPELRCLAQFVDIPGSDRFARMASRFGANASAVVYVFDVNSASSFDHIEEWMIKINPNKHQYCAQLLIGNKCDHSPSERQVSNEAAIAFARQHDLIYCATSAITGEGVTDAFATLIAHIASNVPTPIEPATLLDKRIRFNMRRGVAATPSTQ